MKEVKSSNPQPWRRTSKAMKARTYNHAKREALARTKRRKHDSGHKNWGYNVWTGPMPLLSELMSSRTSAPPLLDGQVLLKAGGLPTSKTWRTSNTAGQQEAVEEMGYPEG
jgi:hypothetical protein